MEGLVGSGVLRVAVTGGAGQIAYSLLFRIASGEMLGPSQRIALHILDVLPMEKVLEGLLMELHDCAFPLLDEVVIGSDPMKVFGDVDIALLVGAKPRGPGMERKDLINDNGKIFVGQGKAINDVAAKDVKVLVVGNPCNTNSLIAMTHAPRIPRKNFFAMTRLDQNRATYQLAAKAGLKVTDVRNMIIWGNHSSTQVPDFFHATLKGHPLTEVFKDIAWLEKDFIGTVQKRGTAVIAARGKSSAASAASAVIDTIKSLYTPTPQGDSFSLGVCSDNNPYGVEENLIFSFPCRSKGQGDYEIIKNMSWTPDLKVKIRESEKELLEERGIVNSLMRLKEAHV